jgi:hypothetical protein
MPRHGRGLNCPATRDYLPTQDERYAARVIEHFLMHDLASLLP